MEEHARQQGDRALYLDTNARLEPAVSIYLGAGFAEISRKGDYIELQKTL